MIERAKPGQNGARIGRPGCGATGFGAFYGAAGESDAIATLCHAIEAGMMIDSADACGGGHDRSLAGKAVAACSAEPFIAPESGIVFDENSAAPGIRLDAASLRRITDLAAPGLAVGGTLF